MNPLDTPTDLSAQRRQFLLAVRRHGFTAAVLGLAGGYLFDGQAMAQTAADEEKKQKAAKVTMLFATEYKIEDYVKYPIMQAKYKDNVEAQSKGQIYCKLHPAGQLGIGAALAQKIQAGTVQGGAVSLSNFSPYTPVVDLINIPYWCGDNQRFANLVTSKAWNDEITPKVMAKGYKPLFYFTVDPRTIATRKGFKLVKTPSDMQGMKMRVPPSKLLQTFYRLAGANPTVVPWGETATAIKQGVADGLDPAISALATFGFHDLLGHISYIRSVPDAQMFAANAAWYQQLPDDLRKAFDAANEQTQIETFAQIEKARTESMRILREGGCQFYNPTDGEMKQWMDTCGEQRKEYDEFKLQFAGSMAAFDNFKKAANTKGPITVPDFKL
ncbi:TRAP transporter substrate-binding protein [Ideonella sp. A 288]|uniref:TRAP transporter substrate-binding protein n=1 Tax=Ideonella sp. A 288 TaxID=1962181 RepID=UPI000B4B671A|nr:TRAP transporter substrate-binding protein [Ideonella sp. A 288]